MAVNDRLNDLTMTRLEPYGITEEQVDEVIASMARDVEA
jgi:hypothetical protein